MNKDLEKLGFKIYSSNSSLDKAKVILLGEAHGAHDKEISDIVFQSIKKNDVLLIEGEEKDKKIPDPFGLNKKIYVYGADNRALATECIKYVAAFQELAESLGDSKLTASQEQNLHSLLNKIHTIQKKRENVFLDAIYEAVQKYKKSQIYFIVGFGHITNDSLCSKLAEKKIDYCALMPLNDKISSEQGLAYIDELKEIYLSDSDKE